MKLLIYTAIVLAVITIALFPSLETQGGSVTVPTPTLLAPAALQRQINAVLRPYGYETIDEDGKLGPETMRGYNEAYSLQQAAEQDKEYYQ